MEDSCWKKCAEFTGAGFFALDEKVVMKGRLI